MLTEYDIPYIVNFDEFSSIAADDSLVWLGTYYGALSLKRSFVDSSYVSKRPVKFTVKESENPSVADNPPSDPKDLFPMSIGDTWTYKRRFIKPGESVYNEDYAVYSVVDTVTINDKLYSMFLDDTLYRKDTSGNIYRGSGLFLDFSNPDISVYECFDPWTGLTGGERTKKSIEVPAGTFDGYFFEFFKNSVIGYADYSIVQGIGLIESNQRDCVGDEEILQLYSARVGGIEYGITSGVAVQDNPPEQIRLNPYPNPFNSSISIEFFLPSDGHTNLSIYNITGQKIRELVSGKLSAGAHTIRWDGKDGNGMKVSSGIYLARLDMDGNVDSVKLTVIK
jgi:hypothetical protein